MNTVVTLNKVQLEFVEEAVKHYSKYKINLIQSRIDRAKAKKIKSTDEISKMEKDLADSIAELEDCKKNGLKSHMFAQGEESEVAKE